MCCDGCESRRLQQLARVPAHGRGRPKFPRANRACPDSAGAFLVPGGGVGRRRRCVPCCCFAFPSLRIGHERRPPHGNSPSALNLRSSFKAMCTRLMTVWTATPSRTANSSALAPEIAETMRHRGATLLLAVTHQEHRNMKQTGVVENRAVGHEIVVGEIDCRSERCRCRIARVAPSAAVDIPSARHPLTGRVGSDVNDTPVAAFG